MTHKLVPIDPTDLPCGLTMPLPDGRIIGENQRIESIVSIEDAYKCAEILHKAMLSAAPTPAQPEKVDVEKLKRDIRQKINEHLMVEDSGLVAVCVRMSIDHLAAAGYLREPQQSQSGDVQEALDAICNGLSSLSIEERDCYQSGFSSEGLRLANIGSQIGAALQTIRAALTAQQPDVNQELLEALKEAEAFIKKMSGGGETDFREKLNKAMLSAAPTPDIPEKVDVEAITDIAWDVFFNSKKPAPYNQMKDVISHLAAAGYLREPLERIEGLDDE